jgi:thioredoxin reductase (NADPH)
MAALPSEQVYDTIIIGGGAAGLSAAMYAGRYLMKTLVMEGHEPGGETAVAWIIENYPGVPKVDGYDLIQTMRSQAKEVGAVFTQEVAKNVAVKNHCFTVSGESGREYYGKTLIFAHGSRRRRLGLPREKELMGHGVSYCVTCDAPLYKNKIIGIIGGGDASVKGAILAAQYSDKVYLIVQGDKLNAEPVNYAVFKSKPNIEVLFNTEVKELLGVESLSGVTLSKDYQGSKQLNLGGLFIEIGAEPNTELPQALGVSVDNKGYIQVDGMMKTNIDGVYAAGDITNATGSFKQDIVAAAQGAIAATSAYRDLGIHGGAACLIHARALAPRAN